MRADPTVLRPEERLFGALAHLATAIPIWGLVINIGLWVYFKERSRELLFHIQQAMVFQGVLLAIFVPYFIVHMTGRLLGSLSDRMGGFLLNLNTFMVSVLCAIYVGYCLWGALNTYLGRPFYYAVFGRRVFDGALRKTSVEE